MLASRLPCVPEFKKIHGPHGGPPIMHPSSFVLKTREMALMKPPLSNARSYVWFQFWVTKENAKNCHLQNEIPVKARADDILISLLMDHDF